MFDHTKDSIEEDIVNDLQGVEFAGIVNAIVDGIAIGQNSRVASRIGGNKFVSTVLAPGILLPDDMPSDVKVSTSTSSSPARNEIGEYIWGEWIPAALKDGSLVCKPDPLVVGQGIDQIQVGVDKWKEGVSGQKIVVELP